MNWYFEEQGISRGPVEEQVLREKIDSQVLEADALIWNPSLKEWGRIGDLMPKWLTKPAPSAQLQATKPETVPEQPAKNVPQTAKPAAKSSAVSTAPVIEEDLVSSPDLLASAAAPSQTKLKPMAPVAAEAEPAQKSGLLKRVFGLGGKKK